MDALLLDYNGVIVDDEPLHFLAFRDVLREEGIALDLATYYSDYLGLNDPAATREAFRREGRPIDPAGVSRVVGRKTAAYAALAAGGEGLRAVPGVTDFVRAAAARARIAVVSGAVGSEIELGLRRAGLRGIAEVVVSQKDAPATKPDPAGYLVALTRLRAAHPAGGPWRVVAIEDSLPGIEAARAIGAGTVAIATSHPAAALSGADRTWADFTSHTPDELEDLWREVRL